MKIKHIFLLGIIINSGNYIIGSMSKPKENASCFAQLLSCFCCCYDTTHHNEPASNNTDRSEQYPGPSNQINITTPIQLTSSTTPTNTTQALPITVTPAHATLLSVAPYSNNASDNNISALNHTNQYSSGALSASHPQGTPKNNK